MTIALVVLGTFLATSTLWVILWSKVEGIPIFTKKPDHNLLTARKLNEKKKR